MGRAGAGGGAHLSDAAAREARTFDELVAAAGDFNPFADRGWATLRRRFETALPLAAPARVLDVGCGTGRSRAIYARRCSAYVGLDLSFGALHAARTRRLQS